MVLISPSRKPASDRAVSVAMIDDELFALLTPNETLGYVHKVGRVYVALRGADYNHAVEVGQTLSRERAIEIVRAA
ncbi:hypothetical protein GCM10027413_13630 [Conyzicola nivalis]|uniref:Uncharacterized protein n=1 Tax=Conyzicola nivalis TaxID=1477021 RepID=A0A916WI30_9MICO|nr:hypothetical protein [Conyzicola nivalis]GGA99931.1 hypothetical protein GCM10010979_13000 [Conyzicola nivalis]